MSNNFAFIDAQNLHLGILDQGWELDYKKFRVYLRDKFSVTKTFLYIGYLPEKQELYRSLKESGFILIFKPTLSLLKDGKMITKGNVDAELVLHAMIEWEQYDECVIVSGDGDFYCLIEHLLAHHKLHRLLIPHQKKFSSLLRRFGQSISFLGLLRHHLSKGGA